MLTAADSWEQILAAVLAEVEEIGKECDKLSIAGANCGDLKSILARFADQKNEAAVELECVELPTNFDFSRESSLRSLKGKLLCPDDINAFLKAWRDEQLPSFSSALFLQSSIFEVAEDLDCVLLWSFCASQWKNRYPSWKEWIVKVALKTCRANGFENSALAALLRRRLRKGKLVPLKDSVALADALQVPIPVDFMDEGLSAAHELLFELKRENDADMGKLIQKWETLETSYGCHCD